MLIKQLINDVSGLSIPDDVLQKLLRTCREIEQEIEKLKSSSDKDVLGDWPNYRGVLKQANKVFWEFERSMHPVVSVAFIDLDKFKLVNDTYGHKHGDEVIIMVAEIIKTSIRRIDVYGRLYGDEFVIILPGIDHVVAKKILDRIKEKLRTTKFLFNTEQLPITLTYGVVSTKMANVSSFYDVLHRADEIMNSQKGNRRR